MNKEASLYGQRVVNWYDRWYENRGGREHAVEFLYSIAGNNVAIEVGVGTGRVAAPLAERGTTVLGIDTSIAMLARFKARGQRCIPVAVDAATLEVLARSRPSIVYCLMGTVFQFGPPHVQEKVFRGARNCLSDGAPLVIEAWVPVPTRMPAGRSATIERVEPDQVVTTVVDHDPSRKQVRFRQVVMLEEECVVIPRTDHYLDPDALDAMAMRAGFSLSERWSSFARDSFGPSSTWHVSVYR